MLGKAAVAMWWDISADVRAEWEEWHTVEHMPERLGIPGFLRGSRWVGSAAQITAPRSLKTFTRSCFLMPRSAASSALSRMIQ